MKKVYICHTIYHIYITLIKQLDKNEKIDFILSTTIPEFFELSERLKKLEIVDQIMIINEAALPLPIINSLKSRIFYVHNIRQEMNKYINYEFNSKLQLFIYNDNTKLGTYLIASKINYHLIEDGLNSLIDINQVADLNYSLKTILLSKFNMTILPYGFSKYAKTVEVNKIEGVKIPYKKLVEVNREKLINSLSSNSKKNIYTFFYGDLIKSIDNLKNVLILTQPLFKDQLLLSEVQQISLYREIVEDYSDKGYEIYIKPHPRDETDYTLIISRNKVINKNVPIEVMNFNPNFSINTVISVTSTAIDGIKFAKNKIKLGYDYLNEKKCTLEIK